VWRNESKNLDWHHSSGARGAAILSCVRPVSIPLDGLFNQLGLDRGGIPKVVPNRYQRPPIPQYYPPPKADQHDRIHIQAEGF